MNHATRFMRLALALVLVGALVLAGCGGDDSGSGITQDMYDALQADYDAAVADREAARAAQMAAEDAASAAQMAQMEAEEAEMAALEAHRMAEERRDTAVAAQAVAESARMAAETARMAAEAAKTEAETTAAEALEAQRTAEAALTAINLDLVAAEAAKATAESAAAIAADAQTRAEAAQAAAEAAQAVAEAAQEMAETERNAAVMAETAAVTARDAAMMAETAAVMAKTAAEGERDAANTARDTAIAERDAAITARDAAIMERDTALAALATQTDAEAAQRARVDAAAIQRSADDITTTRVNSAGDSVVRAVSSTSTVDMFQGSGPIPGDADAMMAGRQTGEMTLTASRVGNTVTFMATADTDPADAEAAEVLINFDATANGNMTSGMSTADLPGGLTKHIFLMSDIAAPLSRSFAAEVPAGLTEPDAADFFDAATQTYRWTIDNNWVFSATVNKPLGDENSDLGINLDRHAAISLDLGDFEPTSASPTTMLQENGALMGYYAGVPGSFRCHEGAGATTNCTFQKNAGGEVIAMGGWQFVPAADPVSIADGDYHVYGAWLKKPDSAVGSGESAGIAAGSDLFDASGNGTDNMITELTGEATYSGSAAGFFAERHVDAEGAVSGTFTAIAELEADFDTSTANGSLSGTITDFVRSDGADVDWLVTLSANLDEVQGDNPATVDVETDFVLNAGILTEVPGGFVEGATSGSASGANWRGEWGAQFTGNGATATQHPSGIVGTFGAQHGTPSLLVTDVAAGGVADKGFVGVIGGFGARKQ